MFVLFVNVARVKRMRRAFPNVPHSFVCKQFNLICAASGLDNMILEQNSQSRLILRSKGKEVGKKFNYSVCSTADNLIFHHPSCKTKKIWLFRVAPVDRSLDIRYVFGLFDVCDSSVCVVSLRNISEYSKAIHLRFSVTQTIVSSLLFLDIYHYQTIHARHVCASIVHPTTHTFAHTHKHTHCIRYTTTPALMFCTEDRCRYGVNLAEIKEN